jgi:hypothetical protein
MENRRNPNYSKNPGCDGTVTNVRIDQQSLMAESLGGRFAESWRSSLGASRNAEHSHALAIYVTLHVTTNLFFFSSA